MGGAAAHFASFYGVPINAKTLIFDSTKADLKFYVSQVYDSITPSVSHLLSLDS